MGCRLAAEMYGIAGDSVYLAVEAIFRIAVWKHEIFRAGGDGKAHPVAGLEGIGQLRRADADFADGIRFHEFRFFEAVPVFYINDAVCQLDGGSIFVDVRDADE